MWKLFITSYLSFTKKERTGILVLLSLIGFFIILPFVFPYFIKQKSYDHLAFEKAIDSLKIKNIDSLDHSTLQSTRKHNYKSYNPSTSNNEYQPKGELFYFDPNSASIADWKKLGIRDKTIATIQKYLSKGGKFYKKEDISKIWGIQENEAQRLMPFIQFKKPNIEREISGKTNEGKEYKKTIYPSLVVDINRADTAAFIALPGIGSKLSQRIINFREKLGGFYKIEQVGETFGLPDSTFQKVKASFKINGDQIRRININVAGIDEMKSHPYLRYALANAIIQYRNQHGNYTTVTDLKKIMTITDEVYNKVVPYLIVN